MPIELIDRFNRKWKRKLLFVGDTFAGLARWRLHWKRFLEPMARARRKCAKQSKARPAARAAHRIQGQVTCGLCTIARIGAGAAFTGEGEAIIEKIR